MAGMPATKPATIVSPDASISLKEAPGRFVSRGGDKLQGALDALGIVVDGRVWLDLGASTGGFTDCLLRNGAASVVAVDVGYGQLDWALRNDSRVHVMERTNARDLNPGDLPVACDALVADVSFISLTVVMPALLRLIPPAGDRLLLVKPQFEVGKQNVGRGGVVRDPELWAASISSVVEAAGAGGLGLAGAVASPLVGPAGNREFFVHLRAGADAGPDAIAAAVQGAP